MKLGVSVSHHHLPLLRFRPWLACLACVGIVHLAETASAAGPYEVTLAWDRNPEPDVEGYRLHYGRESGVYPTVVDVGDVVTATISLPDPGTYYVVATAYNTAGLESLPSIEVVLEAGDGEVDAGAPVFVTLPGDIVVLPDYFGGTSAGVYWDEPTVTDDVGVVSVTSNFASGDQFPAGTSTVTYTATDAAGNQTVESFTVTVGGIELWRTDVFGDEAADPLQAGDFANPDGDRWVNLGEYALGHDATSNDGENTLSQVLADGQHVVVFRHNPYLADVELRVEGCENVNAAWNSVATLLPGSPWLPQIEGIDITSHRVGDLQEVTIIVPLGQTQAAFFRLIITRLEGGA